MVNRRRKLKSRLSERIKMIYGAVKRWLCVIKVRFQTQCEGKYAH